MLRANFLGLSLRNTLNCNKSEHPFCLNVIFSYFVFATLLRLTICDDYFLANLEDQELSGLQPENPTTSNWKFKAGDKSYFWENCDVGKGGQKAGSIDDGNDWIITDWLKSVSHENLVLRLKISYLFWCEKPDDSSCMTEPLLVVLTSDGSPQNSINVNASLKAHHYYNPAPGSKSSPSYRSQMVELPSMPQSSKFKLGLSAGKFCVRISAVQLFHPICQETTMNLAWFKVTFVANNPPDGIQTVFGQCVMNASLPEGVKYASSQDCSRSGHWNNPASACQCNPGTEANRDNTACKACNPGTFKSSLSLASCMPCPANTETRRSGSAKCDCSPGHYRNPDESPDLPCGSTPSMPRKLQFSSIGVDADKTRLFWQMPMDYGMRATVTYKIMCVSGCVLQEPIVTNITEVKIPVEADTLYTYRVYSLNSLSGFYSSDDLRYAEIEFKTPKKYIVQGIGVSELTANEVKLEWERPRGYPGNKYCIRITRKFNYPVPPNYESQMAPDVSCTNHSAQHPEIILSNLQPGTYQFAVRTELGEDAGPYSSQVAIEIQESAMQMGMRHLGLVVGIMLTVCMLFIILCIGMALLYKRRIGGGGSRYRYEQTGTMGPPGVQHQPHFDMMNPADAVLANSVAGLQKMPVGHQLFTEPSFYDDTDQILAELTCELDEKFLQLSSEGTPQEQGATFQGTLFHPATRDHSRVAVKALYLNMATPESGRKFAIEAALMAQFQHVNVCAFYGVIYSNCMWMQVSELCERGPLYRVLQEGAANGSLTFASQLLIMKGIAAGMHYLADFGYVHKVLTSGNVVVNEREVPKICGFDMRALLDESNANAKTFNELSEYLAPWQAPEVCSAGGVNGTGGGKYSSASDVWSFAVVAWEIISQGQEPYGSMNAQQISEFLASGQRLTAPPNCPSGLSKLLSDCWQENRSQRPWFVQINEAVSGLVRLHCTGGVGMVAGGGEFQFPPHTATLVGMGQSVYGKLVDQPNDYYMTLQKVSLSGLEPPTSSPTNTDSSGIPCKPSQPITVREWLKEICMSQYSEKFEQNGYMELKDLFELQDSSLKSLGVTSAKNRKKLLANIALAKIKERKQSTTYSKSNQLNSIL